MLFRSEKEFEKLTKSDINNLQFIYTKLHIDFNTWKDNSYLTPKQLTFIDYAIHGYIYSGEHIKRREIDDIVNDINNGNYDKLITQFGSEQAYYLLVFGVKII